MRRIGVFICWCGRNIAQTVDVDMVKEELEKHPGVAYASTYQYLCSDPGQMIISLAIKKKKLDGVVIASCSPTLHESTFRKTAQAAGLNPHQVEIANIREQCSWVHADKGAATKKAIRIAKSLVEKVALNESLEPIKVPVTKRSLVIGAGISGIQAALDIANQGYEVVLVERDAAIGGHMAQLSETFPTLDCSQCILTPKMVEVSKHPNIRLLAYSEVKNVEGSVGNFKVTIERKPRFVTDKCTACGDCAAKCPVKVKSEFNEGLSERKAVYIPSPQAVPAIYTIDEEHCLMKTKEKCGLCATICEPGAIDFDMQPETIEVEVGGILVATGFGLYPVADVAEYGYGKYPDVINGLQFERLLSASGPTEGEVQRPSDGKIPKEVVFISCIGSRDPENAYPYCSRICCMYTAKHAMLYKHTVHDGQAYVFYMDVRSGGKGYEEFVQRGQEEDGTIYLRGRVSKVFQRGDKLVVWGADTLTNRKVEIEADLVVLATAITANKGVKELTQILKIGINEFGFLNEAHPKLRPVESISHGFYLCGCAQAPKDIPDSVAQAGAAASKVGELLSKDNLEREPTIVGVNSDLCCGCALCIPVCPYSAREMDPEEGKVVVNEVLCESCGSCAAACPTGAAQQKNLTDIQIMNMVKVLMED